MHSTLQLVSFSKSSKSQNQGLPVDVLPLYHSSTWPCWTRLAGAWVCWRFAAAGAANIGPCKRCFVNCSPVAFLFFVFAAHKGLAAYALGSSVVESKASAKRFWSVILAFSLASPVGIFIGYALSSVSNSKGGAALSALASGTFLYVAMMEVIPRELDDPHMRMPKMLTICVGFGLMSLLAVWA
ncbi:ZIP zinc transporter-domain-containing protein [Dunaliella salina]|uniref:ZIP zinc transporter-domain-containing protein n=1 Tax=Dunaliella salina TaxID=3046 RepID=A0ABQ7H1G6_DUNSA|nr:ZIP zinc transporter-domain-containing protein [Dunaliella salina]|eukprot:KAF5840704.1 ZIP zinc transporter-domain-containing protein [Dunaliella salina]